MGLGSGTWESHLSPCHNSRIGTPGRPKGPGVAWMLPPRHEPLGGHHDGPEAGQVSEGERRAKRPREGHGGSLRSIVPRRWEPRPSGPIGGKATPGITLSGETTEYLLRSPTVTPKLQRIAAQAARDSERVFTTLAHLIDADLLRSIPQRASQVPQELTGHSEAYADTLTRTCATCMSVCAAGRYQAAPVEPRLDREGDGSQRPIGKPAFEEEDRPASGAMLLEAIYEQDFPGLLLWLSTGSQSSWRHCTSYESGCMNEGMGWIVDADVSGYFDSMTELACREVLAASGSMMGVYCVSLASWLRAGVMGRRRAHPP